MASSPSGSLVPYFFLAGAFGLGLTGFLLLTVGPPFRWFDSQMIFFLPAPLVFGFGACLLTAISHSPYYEGRV